MPAHQAAGDLKVPLGGILAGLKHAPDAGRIDREGLFHEHIHAFGYSVFQVDR
jgi:hypothetical protein